MHGMHVSAMQGSENVMQGLRFLTSFGHGGDLFRKLLAGHTRGGACWARVRLGGEPWLLKGALRGKVGAPLGFLRLLFTFWFS